MAGIGDYKVCMVAMGSSTPEKMIKDFYNRHIRAAFSEEEDIHVEYQLSRTRDLLKTKAAIIRADLVIFIMESLDEYAFYVIGAVDACNKKTVIVANSALNFPTYISNSHFHVIELENVYDETTFDDDDIWSIQEAVKTSYGAKTAREALFYDLWFPKNVFEIHIVVAPEVEKPVDASLESPNYGFMDNVGDKDAILQIMQLLSRYYPKSQITVEVANEFNPKKLTENMVVIGGPGGAEYEVSKGHIVDDEGNRICKRISELMSSNIAYTPDCESMVVGENTYQASYEGAIMSSDYGYFAAIDNPYAPQNRIVLVHGIHTLGVVGAVRAFADDEVAERNFQVLRQLLRTEKKTRISFETFFQADVFKGETMTPLLDVNKLFFLERHQVSSNNVLKQIKSSVSTDERKELLNKIDKLEEDIGENVERMKDEAPGDYFKVKKMLDKLHEMKDELKEEMNLDKFKEYHERYKEFSEYWDGV